MGRECILCEELKDGQCAESTESKGGRIDYVMQVFAGQCTNVGLYSKYNGEPIKSALGKTSDWIHIFNLFKALSID